MTARDTLATFTLDNIPTLDVAVIGALELFMDTGLPVLKAPTQPLVVLGSVNAYQVAKLIYDESQAVLGNESNYQKILIENSDLQLVYVLSASGNKHAVKMIKAAQQRDMSVQLITHTEKSPAANLLTPEQVQLFQKNREPYTYNVSTYLGPLLAHTGESAVDIANFLTSQMSAKLLRNFADYRAFTFILPDRFAPICAMVKTKFDELFGATITGRAFTESEIMHAKTVVESGDELFISLGVPNEHYGLKRNRLELALPPQAKAATYLSAGYFIVGQIQRAQPPHFAKNLPDYCQRASQIFNHQIDPIVE